VEDLKDRLVGELVEQEADDSKADALGEKEGPVETERGSYITGRLSKVCEDDGRGHGMKKKKKKNEKAIGCGTGLPRSRTGRKRLHEEDREEHDAFGEGGAQDRLNENLRGGAGVPAHCLGGLAADDAYCDSGGEGGDADVEVTGDGGSRL